MSESAVIEMVKNTILDSDQIFSTVTGLTIALLTILIPFAIAALTDHYSRRANGSDDFGKVNLHILLDSVFRVKPLIIFVALIFLSSFLLDTPWRYSLPAYWVVVTVCLWNVIEIILNVYRWSKGNEHQFRIEYLKKDDVVENDLVESWRSVWETNRINFVHERDYLELFSSRINNLLSQTPGGYRTATQLLSDWRNHFKNRDQSFLQRKDVFHRFLEWHVQVFQEYGDTVSDVDDLIWVIEDTIDQLIGHLISSDRSPAFFNAVEEMVGEHSTNSAYVQRLLSVFLGSLFDSLQKLTGSNASMIQFKILKHFPDAWKIASQTIKSNPVQQLVYENFHEWGHHQPLGSASRQAEPFLFDKVVKYIFAKADPILWGRFFEFAWSPWSDEGRVKYFIEREWHLGMIGRSFSGTDSTKGALTDQIQETLELVRLLLGFQKSEVEEFIQEANSLEPVYREDKVLSKRQAEVQSMFEHLLDHIIKAQGSP